MELSACIDWCPSLGGGYGGSKAGDVNAQLSVVIGSGFMAFVQACDLARVIESNKGYPLRKGKFDTHDGYKEEESNGTGISDDEGWARWFANREYKVGKKLLITQTKLEQLKYGVKSSILENM
ncbi:hypothetical protein Dda_2435 [Drechslerella dactyloides]|uniref:Uncharacterized protein n=1 Tax=Drechslerella dactyloides TaxID=74499 RepID=A0AAD6J3K1_DREDA|nr:hypothetical protein Dda_2435 [Drechslerella dactyloides]